MIYVFPKKKCTRMFFQNNANLIESIRSTSTNDQYKAIAYLLKNKSYYNLCNKCVLAHGGSEEDAKDVFSESITALVQNIILNKYKGNSSLKTYFYSICRNIYTRKYHDKAASTLILEDFDIPEMDDYDTLMEERRDLYDHLLAKLSAVCQELFGLIGRGDDYEEIRNNFNWKSTDSVKSTAYRCRKKMRALIKKYKSKNQS